MTISSVLPSTAGAQDDRIQETNNYIRNKCRDTGARFVDPGTDQMGVFVLPTSAEITTPILPIQNCINRSNIITGLLDTYEDTLG